MTGVSEMDGTVDEDVAHEAARETPAMVVNQTTTMTRAAPTEDSIGSPVSGHLQAVRNQNHHLQCRGHHYRARGSIPEAGSPVGIDTRAASGCSGALGYTVRNLGPFLCRTSLYEHESSSRSHLSHDG